MSNENIDELLSKAWQLAEDAYSDPDDAWAFMENAHFIDDNTSVSAIPVALIKKDGQEGFDIVENYLNKRIAQRALKAA